MSIRTSGWHLRDCHHQSEPAFRAVPVRHLMTTSVDVIAAAATVAEARDALAAGGHSAFPLVDGGGAVVGMVSRRDLMQYDVVWAAAGTPRHVFSIAPQELVRVTTGAVVDLKQS